MVPNLTEGLIEVCKAWAYALHLSFCMLLKKILSLFLKRFILAYWVLATGAARQPCGLFSQLLGGARGRGPGTVKAIRLTDAGMGKR